jgi:hypothetical protein
MSRIFFFLAYNFVFNSADSLLSSFLIVAFRDTGFKQIFFQCTIKNLKPVQFIFVASNSKQNVFISMKNN